MYIINGGVKVHLDEFRDTNKVVEKFEEVVESVPIIEEHIQVQEPKGKIREFYDSCSGNWNIFKFMFFLLVGIFVGYYLCNRKCNSEIGVGGNVFEQ